jgi:hypothetical protein
MTASEIAELLRARRTGSGRWMAPCTAHDDSSPSLSIREGQDKRVLVYCFAGCSVMAILASAGLQMSDLFPDPRQSPSEARRLEKQRAEREATQRAERRAEGAKVARVRRLEAIANALLANAARLSGPNGDAIAALGHEALRQMRVAEAALEAVR